MKLNLLLNKNLFNIQKRLLHRKMPSLYSIYTKDQFEKIKEENPTFLPSEIIRKMGENWYNLPPEKKEGYYKKYAELKQKFQTETLAIAFTVYIFIHILIILGIQSPFR